MLSVKENFFETIRGGKPDRFVNQYEAFSIPIANPTSVPWCTPGGEPIMDGWGVTQSWGEDQIGQFPVHDEAHIAIKDIEHWKDDIKSPDWSKITAADWEPFIAEAEQFDRENTFLLCAQIPGIFERTHYLMEIKNALINYMEYEDEMHDLIKYITEWELQYAEQACKYLKPDGVFHHDDWGTQISTFLSPDMFVEFFLEPYKEVYSYWKANTKEGLVVHHSDSYARTLVPAMIEMGIDVWQGPQSTNDVPAMIREFGPKITFMGGIDSGKVDKPDWSKEEIEAETREVCKACFEAGGGNYFIPCLSQGLGLSSYEGVYDYESECIDKMSKELFK